MKGQFQERPKKPKKTPAAPDESGIDAKKKKKAKEPVKTNQKVNPTQLYPPNPMGGLPVPGFPSSNNTLLSFCRWHYWSSWLFLHSFLFQIMLWLNSHLIEYCFWRTYLKKQTRWCYLCYSISKLVIFIILTCFILLVGFSRKTVLTSILCELRWGAKIHNFYIAAEKRFIRFCWLWQLVIFLEAFAYKKIIYARNLLSFFLVLFPSTWIITLNVGSLKYSL